MNSKIKPLQIGSVFGQWVVLKYIGERGKGQNSYWLCRCTCGNEREVKGSSLRCGQSTRCKSCSNKANGRLGLDKMASDDLYVFRCGEYFKIGHSSNVAHRLRTIQSQCPYPVTLAAIFKNRGSEEPQWLAYYNAQHHHGEWFIGDCQDLLSSANGCEIP